jgi:hypothetical protein
MAQAMNPNPIDLSAYVGADVKTATDALTQAGLQVMAPQQVTGPLGMVYQVINLSSKAWPGAVVEPVTLGTTVMGFRVDPQDQIRSLQSQLLQLQGQTFAQAAAPPASASRKRPTGRKE